MERLARKSIYRHRNAVQTKPATSVDVVQLVFKAAGGTAVYQKGPLDRCLRDVLTMNQHVVGTMRTYEMAGRLLLGMEPLRWLF
jgi:hypothetical protein